MSEPQHHEQMMRMITGYWVSQAIYVAAKLGIADLIDDGVEEVDLLAKATTTHPGSLYRLLRALASVGIFAEGEGRRFSLTPLAECLRDDAPGSQRSTAIMFGEEHYDCYGELLESIRTGQAAFDRLFGKPPFEYLAEHPEQARNFDSAMEAIHGPETAQFLDAYDLSGAGTLADVGGGNGSLLIGALRRYPALRGLLVDLPGVVARARPNIEAAGVADRCRTEEGNFFEAVPPGADAYLLRHIIHDWDDERATAILRNVHRAMAPGAKLLVVEFVIPPGNDPGFGKLLDLTMLLIPGGLERTEDQYRQLYHDSGFRLERVVPTSGELRIVVGEKA
jgi:hypothetical protein